MWNDELPNGTVTFTLAHAKGTQSMRSSMQLKPLMISTVLIVCGSSTPATSSSPVQAGPNTLLCIRCARPCSAVRKRNLGYCAGVLGYDASGTGFWLLHSAPRFPVSPDVSAYDGAPAPVIPQQ